jgi:hypothetical protein
VAAHVVRATVGLDIEDAKSVVRPGARPNDVLRLLAIVPSI